METQEQIRATIAANITRYRKIEKMTQAELAARINYSDKSVSKWERGEGVPDIYVLTQLAEIFKISVDDLLAENVRKSASSQNFAYQQLLALFATAVVWLIAVLAFVIVQLTDAPFESMAYLSFIYAIPVTAFVLYCFSILWHNALMHGITTSVFVWGLILSLFLSFNIEKAWLIFLVGIPVQLMAILHTLIKFGVTSIDKIKQSLSGKPKAESTDEKKEDADD